MPTFKKLFIVGCPRSGTTVLQAALNRHSQIVVPPETSFATLPSSSLSGQIDHIRAINADLQISLPPPTHRLRSVADIRSVYDQMAEQFAARHGRDITYFGEKSPRHQRCLPEIWRWFPEAKVILIYRDGRDVAASLARMPWAPGDVFLGFALWLHHHRIQSRICRDRPTLLHCVKYENLATDPERELRHIADFLDIAYDPNMAKGSGNRFGVAAREEPWKRLAAEPIVSSRIGLWKEQLSHREVAIIERWGGYALRALGYELTTNCDERLPAMLLPRVYTSALWWLMRRPPHAEVAQRDAARPPGQFGNSGTNAIDRL